MVFRIPSVVFPWRPGAELQVGQGIPDLQPDAVREAPPLNARTGSPRPQRVIGHDPDGFCQLDRRKTFFSLIKRPPSLGQQAHVTTSHSTNARVRNTR